MTVATSSEIPLTAPKPPATTRFGLRALFWFTAHAPWIPKLVRPIAILLTQIFSPAARRATRLNSSRIFNRTLSSREQNCFCRAAIGSFYDFVLDVGRCSGSSVEDLQQRIGQVDGHDRYMECRKTGRGAVLVTAHMGSFEGGLAALAKVEKHIHVVFKRDPFDGFEQIRTRMRAALGIHEAPIDDGWPALVALRDALRENHVVVMQGDRAIPGQRFAEVPFLGGHLRLPLGPLKLAQLTESPIVPVFTTRDPDGRFHVHLEAPIWVDPENPDAALHAVAKSIETYVARYPQQWLVLAPAFSEDQTT